MKSNIYDDKQFPTKEEIEKAIKEFFNSGDISYNDLSSKVLAGYSYKIDSKGDGKNTRDTSIHTGKGGVLMVLDAYKEAGIPAFIAGESILVFINGEYYPLNKLNIKKNGE